MEKGMITHIHVRFCIDRSFYTTEVQYCKNFQPQHKSDFERRKCYEVKWTDGEYYKAKICLLGVSAEDLNSQIDDLQKTNTRLRFTKCTHESESEEFENRDTTQRLREAAKKRDASHARNERNKENLKRKLDLMMSKSVLPQSPVLTKQRARSTGNGQEHGPPCNTRSEGFKEVSTIDVDNRKEKDSGTLDKIFEEGLLGHRPNPNDELMNLEEQFEKESSIDRHSPHPDLGGLDDSEDELNANRNGSNHEILDELNGERPGANHGLRANGNEDELHDNGHGADDETHEHIENPNIRRNNTRRSRASLKRRTLLIRPRLLFEQDAVEERYLRRIIPLPVYDTFDHISPTGTKIKCIHLGNGYYVPFDAWELISIQKDHLKFVKYLAQAMWCDYNLANRYVESSTALVQIEGRSPRTKLECPRKAVLIKCFEDRLIEIEKSSVVREEELRSVGKYLGSHIGVIRRRLYPESVKKRNTDHPENPGEQ